MADSAEAVRARYPPISDYALLGDCRTAALVSREGSIDWLCLPNFHDDSVFAAVLDADAGGRFAVRPSGAFRVERRYRPETPVLETDFSTDDGRLRLTDCLALNCAENSTEPLPARELLRRIEALEGSPEVEITFTPRPNYGRARPRIRRVGGLGWRFEYRNRLYLLRSDLPLELTAHDSELRGRARLEPGQAYYLSFSCADGDVGVIPPLGAGADARIAETDWWWRIWSEQCSYHGPHREQVLRSAITLKLLDFALTGAVLAAPTCSLPETIGGSRNWDYRYCWLRDAAFTLRCFLDLGYLSEGQSFFGWLLHATRLTWPELEVMYTLHGQPAPKERELPHLEGYCGSRPVRIGNGARNQLQLDMYGEVIMAAHSYVDRGGHLDHYERRLLIGLGKTVCRRWREPDNSIWEVRGGLRHHTFSKLMCWTALNCLLSMHDEGVLKVPRARFAAERAAIREAIESQALHPRLGAYTAEFGTDDADAALLQMSRVGYRPPGDPVLDRTYDFIRERLEINGLMRRYAHGFDHMAGEEGAFGVCTFWAVGHLASQGHRAEAEALFARAAGLANDLGLFAEEYDPHTGSGLGNYPQAFTHVGLIDAALALAEPAPERGLQRAQP